MEGICKILDSFCIWKDTCGTKGIGSKNLEKMFFCAKQERLRLQTCMRQSYVSSARSYVSIIQKHHWEKLEETMPIVPQVGNLLLLTKPERYTCLIKIILRNSIIPAHPHPSWRLWSYVKMNIRNTNQTHCWHCLQACWRLWDNGKQARTQISPSPMYTSDCVARGHECKTNKEKLEDKTSKLGAAANVPRRKDNSPGARGCSVHSHYGFLFVWLLANTQLKYTLLWFVIMRFSQW